MSPARPPDARATAPALTGEQLPGPLGRCFLFVGDAGSCLGGMQDYYGAYDDVAAAQGAVPDGVHWAEVAAVRDGCLEVVATGERLNGEWRWNDLDAIVAPGTVHAAGFAA